MSEDHPGLERGRVALQHGDAHEALECYGRVLREQPRSVPALVGRARAYLALHRRPEAIRDYDAALRIVPDDLQLLEQRLEALYLQRRFADAALDCEAILRLAASHGRARWLRACCRLALGDSLGAQADLRRLLEQEPSHRPAMQLLEAMERELALERELAEQFSEREGEEHT